MNGKSYFKGIVLGGPDNGRIRTEPAPRYRAVEHVQELVPVDVFASEAESTYRETIYAWHKIVLFDNLFGAWIPYGKAKDQSEIERYLSDHLREILVAAISVLCNTPERYLITEHPRGGPFVVLARHWNDRDTPIICECRTREDAQRIADALNLTSI